MCDSTNTHVDKNGCARWYKDKKGWICNKCKSIITYFANDSYYKKKMEQWKKNNKKSVREYSRLYNKKIRLEAKLYRQITKGKLGEDHE